MSDDATTTPAPEVQLPLGPSAVPGPETTAAPAPEPSPEGITEPTSEQTEEERRFTQAELEDAIGKRLARAKRSWEREAAQAAQQPATPPTGELRREDFETDEAFDDARVEQRALQLQFQREAQAEQRRIQSAHEDREEKAREKFEDYDAVVLNENAAISPIMAQVAMQSDVGPEMLYYLAQHRDEAIRIYRLPPVQQAKELGKLEVKLAAEPPIRKTSSAPAPVTPIRTPASKPTVHDTTDPRAADSLSVSEWVAAENKREMARLEARVH